MSSHSSEVSDHLDEIGSCDTYSSGWDRSSTTEYWDSSSDYENDDDEEYHHHKKEVVAKPKTLQSKSIITDIEYKCELVVLPNPYLKFKTAQQTPQVVVEEEKETEEEEEKIPATNPWKMDNSPPPQQVEDPWKFLEEMNKSTEKERPKEHKREDRHKTAVSRPIDNSNTNKLCKYKDECRMNKNNQCNMVHTLSAWKPRICRFNHNCKRKCGYYHTNTPISDYLRTMIHAPDTIYAKNAALYEKYL